MIEDCRGPGTILVNCHMRNLAIHPHLTKSWQVGRSRCREGFEVRHFTHANKVLLRFIAVIKSDGHG
jgi:hypothetical protein